MKLKDKVVIVTGAGSGIGRATALRFRGEGAFVVVADKSAEAVESTTRELAAGLLDSHACLGVETDVSDSSSVRELINTTTERFGRIDVLVNNAGYGQTGTVVDTDEADWDRLMATNVRGVFLCSKYSIPVIAKSGGGAIVNTASYTAAVGINNRAAYVASKGAIVSLTRAMALDHVQQNIRVNAVAPGTIGSPYFDRMFAQAPNPDEMRRALNARSPMNRMGRPEEIANMIVWLASDEASFATGSVFTVDGGTSAW